MLSFLDLEGLEALFPAAEQFYPGTHADLIYNFPRKICCALQHHGVYRHYSTYYIKSGTVWVCDRGQDPRPIQLSLPFQVAAVSAFDSELILTSTEDGLDYGLSNLLFPVSIPATLSDRTVEHRNYLTDPHFKFTFPPVNDITRILVQGAPSYQYSMVILTTAGTVLYANQKDVALRHLECPDSIYQMVIHAPGYLLQARSGNVYHLHEGWMRRVDTN